MSPKLADQLSLVFEQIDALLLQARPHILAARTTVPDTWDRAAFAATLQAFYNGVENALLRIAVTAGESADRSGDWHSALLRSMSRSSAARAAVIDDSLAMRLRAYLQFRHYFRHGYPFDLLWEPMEPLLTDLEQTYTDFRASITAFMDGYATH